MISFSVPYKVNKPPIEVLEKISNFISDNKMGGLTLNIEDDLLFVDSLKARVWIDILNVETIKQDLICFNSLNFEISEDSGEVLYQYLYDISAKRRDSETLSIMVKLAYILSKIEGSFIYNDNGLLDGKEVYLSNEMEKFIQN
ncbi:hypothetical protein [Acinetobacter baumannii]|uniref:hypothetical protein n=1 Tax=Acinetobacter baumannii TaxID=470 RepID=UPI0021C762F9|nr:hypothetical protein [Acinetobacter baumannii]